eukprot:CAMPEP_0179103302 /NCGR_PEP_ID=MMETSP0796-20121207/47859_1 /TAXON_ID=73915 /ORGANISM="Pyrodinium bahamense, Strain pbaha01" /LENGTH=257 /DNA_ID=CAMNT_0020801207 /DNA_START=36 /DNA_END=806 /DNA_ORIENTATION=-
MVAETEVQRALEAVPYQRLANAIDPLGTCPACGAIFPTCLGIKGAWEHTCKWEDAHEALRLRVAEIVTTDMAARSASDPPAGLGDGAVRRVLDALGFQVEPGTALPSCSVGSGGPHGSSSSSSRRKSKSSSSSSAAGRERRRGGNNRGDHGGGGRAAPGNGARAPARSAALALARPARGRGRAGARAHARRARGRARAGAGTAEVTGGRRIGSVVALVHAIAAIATRSVTGAVGETDAAASIRGVGCKGEHMCSDGR